MFVLLRTYPFMPALVPKSLSPVSLSSSGPMSLALLFWVSPGKEV